MEVSSRCQPSLTTLQVGSVFTLSAITHHSTVGASVTHQRRISYPSPLYRCGSVQDWIWHQRCHSHQVSDERDNWTYKIRHHVDRERHGLVPVGLPWLESRNPAFTIAGQWQCRTNPKLAVPEWTLMPECRCRIEAAGYQKKCRCRTNFSPAFRLLQCQE